MFDLNAVILSHTCIIDIRNINFILTTPTYENVWWHVVDFEDGGDGVSLVQSLRTLFLYSPYFILFLFFSY